MDVFIKAAEYMEIPVRRTDGEPLQKLFMLVRSELNLDLKNIKQEQAKFWKQHPALVKVLFWWKSMWLRWKQYLHIEEFPKSFALDKCKFDLIMNLQILTSQCLFVFLEKDTIVDSSSTNSWNGSLIPRIAAWLQTCTRICTSPSWRADEGNFCMVFQCTKLSMYNPTFGADGIIECGISTNCR